MVSGLRFRVKRAARQIGDQHRHMQELMKGLETAIADEDRAELRYLMTRYQGAIDAHFSLEDDVFFPALHGLHPEHSQALEALSGEHRLFIGALEGLRERLDSDGLAGFGEGLREIAGKLAEHEVREETLVRSLAELPGD